MSRHTSTEALSSYLDRQVEPRESRDIERHLEECLECRDKLEGLRHVVEGLRSLESVAPPAALGLELQRRLSQTVPPFAGRGGLTGGPGRLLLQPVVLAGLGIVLALAIIVLLFLQALERDGAAPVEVAPPAASSAAAASRVIIGEREFERLDGRWVETSLSDAELGAARPSSRAELDSPLPSEADSVLGTLSGPVTLRLGDEVVAVSD